nr:hypothetical protein [Tanacetum cinerariifolium]
MEEYIRLEEEKARRNTIVFDDAFTSDVTASYEPMEQYGISYGLGYDAVQINSRVFCEEKLKGAQFGAKTKIFEDCQNFTNTPYPTEEIRHICAKTSQENAFDQFPIRRIHAVYIRRNGFQQKDKNKAKTDKTKHEMEKHGKIKVKVNQKVNQVKSQRRLLNGPTRTHLIGPAIYLSTLALFLQLEGERTAEDDIEVFSIEPGLD